MSFDDMFGDEDFMIIDEDDLIPQTNSGNGWDTGSDPDIFASGEKQDIFSTR